MMNGILIKKILPTFLMILLLSSCANKNAMDDDACNHEAGTTKTEQPICKNGDANCKSK